MAGAQIEREVKELAKADGTWDDFLEDWKRQCDRYDEPFESYAEGMFSVISELINKPHPTARVLAFCADGEHVAVCHANTALIKGYSEPVLRVRHLTLSPEYDFGSKSVQDYGNMLVIAFAGILFVSDSHENLSAKHIKFHLRSPADRPFFTMLGQGLNETDEFASVHTTGAWLYITKA